MENGDEMPRETIRSNARVERRLFVNLPVQDLEKSVAFFTKLGFSFDSRFTDEKATCMIVNGQASVMLLTRSFFQTFTRRAVCDSTRASETLLAISCESRSEVDDLVETAVATGGAHAMEPQDHGFMYGWSFLDLDGHHWEVLWMDPDQSATAVGGKE